MLIDEYSLLQLTKTKTPIETPASFIADLGLFYEQVNYSIKQHKRVDYSTQNTQLSANLYNTRMDYRIANRLYCIIGLEKTVRVI